MWSPTHVNVIIRKATNLLSKGKNSTNNAFVVIELGKESYRTSIKDNVGTSLIVWQEECEFRIPNSGNTASVVVTALHRNSYGLDRFLGFVDIPLSSFDKSDNSTRWYKLRGKPGRDKEKEVDRGQIEVTVQFAARPSHSLTDLADKEASKSFASLLNIRKGEKVLSFRELTRKAFKKKAKDVEEKGSGRQSVNPDPGVVTDDEEDQDVPEESISRGTINDSGTTTRSKLSMHSDSDAPLKPPRIFASDMHLGKHLIERKLSNSCLDLRQLKSPKDVRKCLSSLNLADGAESQANIFSKFSKKLRQKVEKREQPSPESHRQSKSVLAQFSNKTREELIIMIIELQRKVNRFHVHVSDLEEYLDGLLLKIMETTPTLLEKGSSWKLPVTDSGA